MDPSFFAQSSSKDSDSVEKAVSEKEVAVKNSDLTIKCTPHSANLNSGREKPIKGNKKNNLKNVIKSMKQRSIEYLEEKLADEQDRRSPVSILLAKHYSHEEFEKAKEVLTESLLPEAKLTLMELALEHKDFDTVIETSEYLVNSKCTCEIDEETMNKRRQLVSTKKQDDDTLTNLCPAENPIPDLGCLKHVADQILEQAQSQV